MALKKLLVQIQAAEVGLGGAGPNSYAALVRPCRALRETLVSCGRGESGQAATAAWAGLAVCLRAGDEAEAWKCLAHLNRQGGDEGPGNASNGEEGSRREGPGEPQHPGGWRPPSRAHAAALRIVLAATLARGGELPGLLREAGRAGAPGDEQTPHDTAEPAPPASLRLTRRVLRHLTDGNWPKLWRVLGEKGVAARPSATWDPDGDFPGPHDGTPPPPPPIPALAEAVLPPALFHLRSRIVASVATSHASLSAGTLSKWVGIGEGASATAGGPESTEARTDTARVDTDLGPALYPALRAAAGGVPGARRALEKLGCEALRVAGGRADLAPIPDDPPLPPTAVLSFR